MKLRVLLPFPFFVSVLCSCTPVTEFSSDSYEETVSSQWVEYVFLDVFNVNGGKTVVPDTAIEKSFKNCSEEELAFFNFMLKVNEGMQEASISEREATARLSVERGRQVIKG